MAHFEGISRKKSENEETFPPVHTCRPFSCPLDNNRTSHFSSICDSEIRDPRHVAAVYSPGNHRELRDATKSLLCPVPLC